MGERPHLAFADDKTPMERYFATVSLKIMEYGYLIMKLIWDKLFENVRPGGK